MPQQAFGYGLPCRVWPWRHPVARCVGPVRQGGKKVLVPPLMVVRRLARYANKAYICYTPCSVMAFSFLRLLTGRGKKEPPGFYEHPLPKLIFNRHSLRYLAANKAAQNLYGYTEEEFKVLTLREIRPVWELQKLERHLNEQALYGNNTGVWKHLKKNGDIMLVKVNAEDVEFNGEPQRLVTIEEITPKRISTHR